MSLDVKKVFDDLYTTPSITVTPVISCKKCQKLSKIMVSPEHACTCDKPEWITGVIHHEKPLP